MPGGGGCGGSLEWLLDEPGFESPVDCDGLFFIPRKKAIIAMNLKRFGTIEPQGRSTSASDDGTSGVGGHSHHEHHEHSLV